MQDLLRKDGKFLSLDEFNEKFGLKINYLKYFQITAAIPSSLKRTAQQTRISSECLFSTPDLLHLSEDNTLPLSKMRCKHYYKLFNVFCVGTYRNKKNGKKIFQTVFLIGEETLSRYTRLLKITSLGNFYLKYYTG